MYKRQYHEQFADVLLDSTPDACFVIVDGVIADANPGTFEIFGATREQMIGVSPGMFSPEFQPDGRSSMGAAGEVIGETLEKGHKRFEWVHCRRDGAPFTARVNLFAAELDGKPAIVCSLADISEVVALREEQAKQAEKACLLYTSPSPRDFG